MTSPTTSPTYAERLWAPLSWWLLGLGFVVCVGWAFFVATPLAVTVVAVVVVAVLVVAMLLRLGSVRIVVDAEALRAGRAVLPRANVGDVEAMDPERTQRVMGTEADARAFLVTRPYVGGAVRVEVVDVTDPTPYWVISSRDPQALATSLTRV